MRETLTREQEAALDALKATILDPATPTEDGTHGSPSFTSKSRADH